MPTLRQAILPSSLSFAKAIVAKVAGANIKRNLKSAQIQVQFISSSILLIPAE